MFRDIFIVVSYLFDTSLATSLNAICTLIKLIALIRTRETLFEPCFTRIYQFYPGSSPQIYTEMKHFVLLSSTYFS